MYESSPIPPGRLQCFVFSSCTGVSPSPSFLPPVASRYNWKRRSLPGLGTRPRDGDLLEAKAAGSECSATW